MGGIFSFYFMLIIILHLFLHKRNPQSKLNYINAKMNQQIKKHKQGFRNKKTNVFVTQDFYEGCLCWECADGLWIEKSNIIKGGHKCVLWVGGTCFEQAQNFSTQKTNCLGYYKA